MPKTIVVLFLRVTGPHEGRLWARGGRALHVSDHGDPVRTPIRVKHWRQHWPERVFPCEASFTHASRTRCAHSPAGVTLKSAPSVTAPCSCTLPWWPPTASPVPTAAQCPCWAFPFLAVLHTEARAVLSPRTPHGVPPSLTAVRSGIRQPGPRICVPRPAPSSRGTSIKTQVPEGGVLPVLLQRRDLMDEQRCPHGTRGRVGSERSSTVTPGSMMDTLSWKGGWPPRPDGAA